MTVIDVVSISVGLAIFGFLIWCVHRINKTHINMIVNHSCPLGPRCATTENRSLAIPKIPNPLRDGKPCIVDDEFEFEQEILDDLAAAIKGTEKLDDASSDEEEEDDEEYL